MAHTLKGKKLSPTGKRLDCTVQKKDFLGIVDDEFELRIIGRVEMDDEMIKRIINEVLDRKGEASKKKEDSEYASLRLKSYNGNAYIKLNDDE